METSGIVCKTVSRLPATTRVVDYGRQLNSIRVSVRPPRKIQSCRRLSCQFSDSGHVRYYVSPRSGAGGLATKKDKEKNSEIKRVKKKLKLIKRLSKDLSLLPQITNGDDIRIGLAAEAQVTMIHEASDSLMAQLQKLKTEQKELKRKLKEEKAQLKATMGKSSSSSSSESSDSDCGEVVDMKTLRNNALKRSLEIEAPTDYALEQSLEIEAPTDYALERSLEIEAPTDDALEQSSSLEVTVAAETTLANSLLELENSDSSPQFRVRVPRTEFDAECSSSTKKIEVCMGGKCKKLGGGALLEEFEKKVGAEGSVVACKCMGKCKTAPNVRVLNNSESGTGAIINEDSVRLGFNSTCTGVGLQDVDLIVANLLGKEIDDECMMLSS